MDAYLGAFFFRNYSVVPDAADKWNAVVFSIHSVTNLVSRFVPNSLKIFSLVSHFSLSKVVYVQLFRSIHTCGIALHNHMHHALFLQGRSNATKYGFQNGTAIAWLQTAADPLVLLQYFRDRYS